MKTASVLGWVMCIGVLSAGASAGDFHADYRALVAAQEPSPGASEQDVARRIEAIYTQRFEPTAAADLDGLSTADVDVLFRAATIATGYTFNRVHVQQMKRAYDVLAARGALQQRYAQNLFESLMFARMFDEAQQFAEATPSLGVTLPAFRTLDAGAGRPTIWTFQNEGRTLVQRAAELRSPMIVVVAHPLCSFSQAAATQIGQDADLSARFGPPSLWLLPQTALFDAAQVQAWETAHAPFAMAYASTQGEWAMIDSWATPTFYFLRNGRVVHKVVGWPAEGRKAELLAGVAALDRP